VQLQKKTQVIGRCFFFSKKAHQRKCKDKEKGEEQVASTKTKITVTLSSLHLLLTASSLATTAVLTLQPLLNLIIEFLLGNHDVSTLGNESHSTDTDHVVEELAASSYVLGTGVGVLGVPTGDIFVVGDSLSRGKAHGIVAGSIVARHGEGVCESGGVVSGGRNFGGWWLVIGY
jgi:hypothetical protein